MKKKYLIMLCCMGVLLGAVLVGYVWEKNERMTIQEDLAGKLAESESLVRERDELRDRLSELERKFQEQEPHNLEILALPLSEAEHREIMQKQYISGKGMIAYKVPIEVETLKCEESIPDYCMLYPLGAVLGYNADTGAYDNWIMVAWGGITGSLYDKVGWVKQEDLTEYSETSKCILLFDQSSKENLQADLVQESMAKMELIFRDAMAPASEVSEFVYVFDLDEKEGEQTAYAVEVAFTCTTVREPMEDPVIVGMYQAKDLLSTEEEKEVAQKIIDGFLAEMPQMGDKTRVSYRVTLVPCEGTQYELRYTYTNEGKTYEVLLEDFFVKIDEGERIQLGIETLEQNMK